MAITAKQVNELRQRTGAGIMDCKKALTETNCDFEKAIEVLRKKGQKISLSRSDRKTTEGSVFIKTSKDGSRGMIMVLSCETDFVGKNEEFRSLGEKVADIAFENNSSSIKELNSLPFDSINVGEKITEFIGKIGEKIEIKALDVLKGEKVVSYIHAGHKLGVLVALKGVSGIDPTNAGQDIAMQIAAMNPIAVDKNGVASSVIKKEIEIGKDLARQEGKPETILEKIAMGRLSKFFKEQTLLNQTFVKNNSLNVSQYLDSVSKGLTVSDFKRVSVG